MFTLLLVIGVLVFFLFLAALFYWLGGLVVSAPKVTYLRALLVSLAGLLLNILLGVGAAWLLGQSPEPSVAFFSAVTAADIVLSTAALCAVIAGLFWVSAWRALLVWLAGLVGGVVSLLVLYAMVVPYLFAAYVVPANPMAPAVVGWHYSADCPDCSGPLVLPANPPGQHPYNGPVKGVCGSCRKFTERLSGDAPLEGPDRILVNLLASVRRWDIVSYRMPDPSTKFPGPTHEPGSKGICRVVGLPGEKVYLKDDAVWINDAKIAPPNHLRGQVYRHWAHLDGPEGTPERPWRLGPTEYVLLGDNGEGSFDSRTWGPLPARDIEGVVGITYWPLSRFRLHP